MIESYQRLFRNNRQWAEEQLARDPHYFDNLSAGQSPQYLLIGCSDSRVPPNEITKTAAGEIFIHRNVANLVVHTDMNLMSVLQYAVEVLRVKHVIVMGHYGCGGVQTAIDGQWHGLIDKWLRNIQDVYRLHQAELDAIPPGEQRLARLVELNVREQVYNLYKSSIIQRAGDHTQVHGWVFDMKTGLIKDIEDELPEDWKRIKPIYKYDF